MGAAIATPITVTLTLLSTRPKDFVLWCKWIISYVFIEVHRRYSTKRLDLYDYEVEKDPYKVNFLPPPEEAVLESPLPENQLHKTVDEVFFYGMNSKSDCLIVRVARGPDNESDAFIRLSLEDGRTYELKETRGFQQSCCDNRVFSCGDLQVHYLSPMRRWRIFFNGVLMDTSSEKMVHIKFSFLWRALSDAFDFTTDVNVKNLANGLSRAKWTNFLPPLHKFQRAFDGYVQAGAMQGSVTVEGMEDDVDLYLFGEKLRFIGETAQLKNAEFFHVLGRTFKNGRLIHIIEASIPNVVENFSFGFIIQPNGAIENITNTSIDIKSISNDDLKEHTIETNFNSDDVTYKLQGTLFGEHSKVKSNKVWEGRFTINCFNFQLNSVKGSGIIIKGKITKPVKRTVTKSPESQVPSASAFVVHFSEKSCQNPELTGGKGSSLGKLTELSKDFQNFVVPNGIVVTTYAYEQFLTKAVLQEIKNLERCIYTNKGGDMKQACQKVMDEVVQSIMPEDVSQEVVKNLQVAFPGGKHSYKFAVRSSATGEDTEQMSAAGQMETYLGVTGVDEIMLAVKKCWASQFSHIAVQYKRQNGQVLNSPMAVVIQQMVSCDVAGVLFTCDPLTGDPTHISITANYGLGESVVSGSEEPDTIELRRNDEDKLIVKNKVIGSKSRRVVIKENEKGTYLEDVPENEQTVCCLTDEMALRLGNLAVKIEKCYRSRRDIEWGFWNNNLYIFQSRPVTSGTGETDFEIEHEFDAPLRVEEEYYTVCNVGEVMPGAMSPLGAEVILKFFDIVFKKPRTVDWTEDHRPTHFPAGLCQMYSHIMFYCVDLLRRISENKATTEATLVALFGRIIEDEDLMEMAMEKHGHRKKQPFLLRLRESAARFQRLLYYTPKRLKQGQKMYANYRIEVEKCESSQEMFNALLTACTDLSEAMYCHCISSESSTIWNMITLSLLKNARGELNSDVYGDFGQLLTTCSEVESADVPAALEKLASYISKDIKPEDFKRMDTNEAVIWLQSSTKVSGIKYREFISKHGHRCLKEFDIHSHTWETNPSSLIQLLQNLVGSIKSDKTKKPSEDINKLISELRTPLNFKQRFMLKVLLIPMSRRAVQCRESSKSLLIRGVDAWRKGYTRLAQLMAIEGRIPDHDLLFFMTLEEIKELLATRSPRIIAKAIRRRRRHPTLDKYIFPEISKGFPKPINMETHPIVTNDDSFSMQGIPVSQGVTKGFVRVAITLEEASFLQPGEILVTYSTDIGWSPYFPMLAGVVTELGGLISHGAVVSREYGLPCIAGLHGATRQFQTGDYVLMDGNKGILQKLPRPEKE